MDHKWHGIALTGLFSLALVSCATQDAASVISIAESVNSNADVMVTIGAGKDEALSRYVKEVMKLASKTINYPRRSIHLGERGTVMLAVEMNRDGSDHQCSIWSSSRFSLLDNEAMSSCSKTTFPPLSNELLARIPPDQERVGITYHVKFDMHRSRKRSIKLGP